MGSEYFSKKIIGGAYSGPKSMVLPKGSVMVYFRYFPSG